MVQINSGQPVPQYQVSKIMYECYGRATTRADAEKGFRATGIWLAKLIWGPLVFTSNYFENNVSNKADESLPLRTNISNNIPIKSESITIQVQDDIYLRRKISDSSPVPMKTSSIAQPRA